MCNTADKRLLHLLQCTLYKSILKYTDKIYGKCTFSIIFKRAVRWYEEYSPCYATINPSPELLPSHTKTLNPLNSSPLSTFCLPESDYPMDLIMWNYMVFVLFCDWLTSCTIKPFELHPYCCRGQDFLPFKG